MLEGFAFLSWALRYLQTSRLPSHCADEETGTQNREGSCLRPPGTEPEYLTPSPVLFPCVCGSGAAVLNNPWLQAGAGDGQPPGGVPGGRLKFLLWPEARVDVLRPFLWLWPSWPASRRKEQNLWACPLRDPATGAWPLATCLFGVWIAGT